MKSGLARVGGLAAVIAVSAGCSLTPAYQRPEQPLPQQWESATSTGAVPAQAQWWTAYGSAELDGLMRDALAANHDLAAALARIEQARASARAARAALLPNVTAAASAEHDRRRTDGSTSTTDDGQAALSVSYEVDLWGANAAGAEAAEARVASSRYTRDSVALVLQADVATGYFQLLALHDRLAIAQKNLEAARELLRLVQVRFDNGAATALDLAQQRTTLLSIQAQIPSLQQSVAETRHALAVLLGRAPQGFAVQTRSLAELSLPSVDPGQPALLLSRRPDVRAAEAALIAAHADIGAARAALYPGLELSASAGVSGLLSGGSTTLASAVASLAQTIFDGGRLRGQLAFSEATRLELVETYAQTVLVGLQEAEDSLSAVATQQDRVELLRQTAEQAREAYRLATVRYESGAEDLLTVLDSLRSLLTAEDSLVQAQMSRYAASASLVKALGGGWAPSSNGDVSLPPTT